MLVGRFILFFLFAFCFNYLFSQQNSISLKIGAVRMLNAPAASTRGFAYRTFAPHSPYPALHLEYKKDKFLKKR